MRGRYVKIMDEMVERSRSRIGKVFIPREPYFNTAATKDAIRHFVRGIGDPNPLWVDEEYARRTRYGCIIAPPTFLYSVYWPIAIGACFPGIHAWHGGNDIEFFRPIKVNDSFSVTDTITDLVEKKNSKMAGRIFIASSRTVYTNQNEQVIAVASGWNIMAERNASKQAGKYSGVKKPSYTHEELRKIEEDYDREEIRGANPRYWEDVHEGDELIPVVKGPLSTSDIICWLMGGGSPYMLAHGFALAYRRRHPKIEFEGGDHAEYVHLDNGAAQEVGLPYSYDYGAQRISWLGHLLTNWMGDDGFLKKLYVKLVGFNMRGYTTWCRGKVIRKYEDDGEQVVDCEIWCENQISEVTATGKATIILPSRERGY
jgi:acyl dehydratase